MRNMKLSLLVLALTALALSVPSAAIAVAPGATTGAATNVGSTTATVSGTVNPNKEATNYHFEYGTTPEYGTSTPTQSAGGGNAGKTVTANLSALTPSTTYHYRLVAANASGTTAGNDMTFTTLAPGQPPPEGNTATITATPATITFGRTTTISGQVTGPGNSGVQVSLQSVPAPPFVGGKFTDTGATATTDASGNYTFALVMPLANTNYQVVAKTSPPVTSPVVTVNVRIAVSLRLSDSTPRRDTLVRFHGVAKPAHDGAVVRIQRRTSTGSFRTVAKTLLRKSTKAGQSTYSRRLRIHRSGTYRARVPADSDHARGTSRRLRITVH